MTKLAVLHLILYLGAVLVLVKPLGYYIARVYEGQFSGPMRLLVPVEGFIYRWCRIRPENSMGWTSYLIALLLFNLFGLLLVYGILRWQDFLPLNPQHFSGVSPELAFNIAVSFTTNTNWQSYSGETTLSYLSQMLGLTVQNFLSPASAMAVLMAFIRGLTGRESWGLGNFWVDLTRGVLYILLPLSLLFATVFVSEGVIQNFKPYQKVAVLQSTNQVEQTLPMGPVASQVAIKQLGSNGGGYFNANSAHPFENPTPFTNFLQMLAILLIPAALCYTFGVMVKDTRQGWAILATMLLIFIPFSWGVVVSEQGGNPLITQLGVNMEGKETRFGAVASALWASATTATANGSVNAMLDSFTPLGGLIPLWFIQLGEVVFGGMGSGLLGMLILVIMTVFVAGIMIGRTPEYLGKKIEPYEMKMAALAVLIAPLVTLTCTAIAVTCPAGTQAVANPGAHGFTEILYAFSSLAHNNGSAFAGLNANTSFYNNLGSLAMLIGRYWIAIPTLALAGSLAQKQIVPQSSGTLPTYQPLFIVLLMSVILIVGALTFFPALALGPIVEHFLLWGTHGG